MMKDDYPLLMGVVGIVLIIGMSESCSRARLEQQAECWQKTKNEKCWDPVISIQFKDKKE